MNAHEKDIHKVNKYHCDLCDNYFTKFEKLEEHKTKKHNIGLFPCNECHYKAMNLSMLDDHIAQCHVMKKKKDIDIRDVTNKKPCDPSHPRHSSECCDRLPRLKKSNQSKVEERRRCEPCRYWNQGHCFRGDSCKFSHVKICRFQEQCRATECRFFHYSEQESFLEQRFSYREEDFPPMENRSRRRNL